VSRLFLRRRLGAKAPLGCAEQGRGERGLLAVHELRQRTHEHVPGEPLGRGVILRAPEEVRVDAREAEVEALLELGLSLVVFAAHEASSEAGFVPALTDAVRRQGRPPPAPFYKVGGFTALLLLACAGPRTGGSAPAGAGAAPSPPTATPVVVDSEGRVPAAEAEQALGRAAAPDLRRRARALANAIQAGTGTPLVRGNRTRLLVDGPRTYAAMFDAVERARHHIHIETYIFADDEVGRRFADALARKRREGVAVRIIYDAIGSIASDSEFFAGLAAKGIEVAEFRPLRPSFLWRVNHRDHRKLTVVDGRVAFTGGLNISGTYSKASTSRPGPEQGLHSGWRDTHLEIRGPAVRLLQSLFLQTWTRLGRRVDPSGAALYPALDEAGDDLVQVVASEGGDAQEFRIYGAYLAAIRSARERVWISQAYFAPNREFREALSAAKARGVDVRVIVPAFTDSALIHYGSRATYQELLDHGVAIFEHEDALMHAKTAVVDGVWSTVGSCNVDARSFVHNDELNAAVLSVDLARDMEAVFRADLEGSRRIDPEEWRARPRAERVKEALSRLFAYWL
jgi:cardiolipin synthase